MEYKLIAIINQSMMHLNNKQDEKMRLIFLKNLQKQRTSPKRKKKALAFQNANRLLERRQEVLNGFY